eukprot:GDKI01025328.1.p1 GENE.GDKI01025328.1~~GDKI01025328.1.p1  ORF type:complete len:342 (-),score=47.67 GDKI01025328.1:13-1038(-)
MSIFYPTKDHYSPQNAPLCAPPSLTASAVRAGVIMPGSKGSFWLATPGKGKLRPTITTRDSVFPTEPEPGFMQRCGNLVAGMGEGWVLYTAPEERESLFWVHDNGGKPFLLRITPRVFAVYRKPHGASESAIVQQIEGEDRSGEHIAYADQDFSCLYGQEIEWDHPSKYTLLAAEPSSYVRCFVGDHDSKTHPHFGIGNSCLIEVEPRQWLWVSVTVQAFTTTEDIHEYHSPIGNNDVPYPYAISDTHTYFLNDNGKVPNTLMTDTHHPDVQAYRVLWNIQTAKYTAAWEQEQKTNPLHPPPSELGKTPEQVQEEMRAHTLAEREAQRVVRRRGCEEMRSE